jgi:hypothetical protein
MSVRSSAKGRKRFSEATNDTEPTPATPLRTPRLHFYKLENPDDDLSGTPDAAVNIEQKEANQQTARDEAGQFAVKKLDSLLSPNKGDLETKHTFSLSDFNALQGIT